MPNMDGHQAKKIISNDPTCEDPYIVALTANSDQVRRESVIFVSYSVDLLANT